MLIFSAGLWLPEPAGAQTGITSSPICSTLYNDAPYTVYGTVLTDAVPTADGQEINHRQVFKLSPGGRSQFCSTGPFYPGGRLEIQLRTLFPIFDCKTKIDREVVIRGRYEDDDTTKTWIDCR